MKREVLSLVVACPNSSDGCEWRGEVRYIDVSQTSICYSVLLLLLILLILLLYSGRFMDTDLAVISIIDYSIV